MNSGEFEILPFSSANLFRALENRWCKANDLAAQIQPQYLLGYLEAIAAKTIVVEPSYTDGDYLEDFASYYVRCHETYDRQCKRLHFFSIGVSEQTVRDICLNSATPEVVSAFKKAYLGFVVARPLPSAIIGRTLLRTYPKEKDQGLRNYTVLRDYHANLFGIHLTIESLPYQEQDSVLAACATVALWCAFHKTAELFGTPSPRPAVITRTANRAGHRGRPVPSHGLRVEEMCHAVADVNLEPELVDCEDKDVPLISLAYAHLRMGLPVILIVDIEDELHAITLTGYSLLTTRANATELSEEAIKAGEKCIPMVGLRINELYGHDDQIGPFARLVVGPSAEKYPVVFSSSWKDKGTQVPLVLKPFAVLIPVYNKIRVTFGNIQKWLTRLHSVVSLLAPEPDTQLEWDVYLMRSNDFKEEILASSMPAATRERLLFAPQPRFLWRATLRMSGSDVLELIFDATDMARSFPLKHVIWRHAEFTEGAKGLLLGAATQASLAGLLTARFLDELKKSLSQ